MRTRLRQALTKKLQKLFWVYHTNNFIITRMSDCNMVSPATACEFTPITSDNCVRARDFRDDNRVSEYRGKLARGEIGYFAELAGTMAGSIWATINKEQIPTVVRTYMRLAPNEALIHDIVTGEKFRGKGVAPFMVGCISSTLLNDYRVSKIIIDVNVTNKPSLRMMDKAHVPMKQEVLYISALGSLIFQKVLKEY